MPLAISRSSRPAITGFFNVPWGRDGKPFVLTFDRTVTRAGIDGTLNSESMQLKRGESSWQIAN